MIFKKISLLLTVLGLLVTVHLDVQKKNNFENGCWGFEDAVNIDNQGCADPRLAAISNVYGIALTDAGTVFFLALGAMLLMQFSAKLRLAKSAEVAADVLLALAVPYAVYLFYYQAAVAHAFCSLCVAIEGIIALLATVRLASGWRKPSAAIEPQPAQREYLTPLNILGFAGLGVLASLLTFHYDFNSPPMSNSSSFKTADWVNDSLPVLGTRTGVPVVIFLDPNCPHCSASFNMVISLANKYKEEAGFYIIPRPLWQFSLVQTDAIELAREQGKYFEMWEWQFKRQEKMGLTLFGLTEICASLGMDTTDLAQQLSQRRAAVLQLRDQADRAGIYRTPTIYVDAIPATNATARNISRMEGMIKDAIARRKTSGTEALASRALPSSKPELQPETRAALQPAIAPSPSEVQVIEGGMFVDAGHEMKGRLPDGWSIRRVQNLGAQETTIRFADPAAPTIHPSLYYEKLNEPWLLAAEKIEPTLRGNAEKKARQRISSGLSDYKNNPPEMRTIGGKPALAWTADFTRNGKPWREYFTLVYSPRTVALYFLEAPAADLAAIQLRFQQLIDTTTFP